MFKSFFFDPKYRLFAWGVLAFLICLVIGQVYLSVLINDWYKVFYNSLEKKDALAFWSSFITFGYLATSAILVRTFSVFISQHYTFKWREALTFVYLPQWKNANDHIEGSSQRIQEDTMRFAKMVYRLGLGSLHAIMTLIAFVPILWSISTDIVIFDGFKMDGMLVWFALLTSVGGLFISIFMGRKLPRLEYNNQKTEAAFRKSLVYGEDNKGLVNMDLLQAQFQDLKINYFALFNQFKYFNLWENTYAQASIIIPYLIGAPAFFAGAIALGVLVQIGNAFDKVHESFGFFLYNWTDVTELQSIVMRLREFQKAIDDSPTTKIE